MNVKYILSFLIIFSINLLAQYQTRTIPELNLVPDSILTDPTSQIVDLASQYVGDTIKVSGVVTFAPLVDWENDRRTTTSAEEFFQGFIQAVDGAHWGGLQVIQLDTTAQTGFDIVDTGDVVELTGVIEEFFNNTTRLQILTDPLTEVNIIDNIGQMPDPIVVSFDDFFDGNKFKFDAEKYESMYVEFQNVTTVDFNANSSTQFSFTDASGNLIYMYDQSGYFSKRSHKLVGLTDYDTPAAGTFLEHIRGIVHTRNDGWYMVPLYPGDIKVGTVAPATISMIENTPARVMPNESADVSFKIIDNDGTVEEAKLYYQVDNGEFNEVVMTFQDTVFVATIPGINSDSAMVNYFIYAKDDAGNESLSPTDTSRAFHYFWVLNEAPSIFHVQYTPYRGGASRFEGEVLELEGVITADSSDIDGDRGGSAQYMQIHGHDKWAGVRMTKVPLRGQKRGDLVKVTGTIIEDFFCTTLEVSELQVLSSGVPIDPLVLTCDMISTGRNDAAEEYEGMLLKYENLTVSAQSADDPSNFGEILVTDGTLPTRVELEDGLHSYHNSWDPSLADSAGLIELNQWNTLESVTGVLYYSFNNFKLIPRNDDDFVGLVTDVKGTEELPSRYELSQNYPNPFNPSTLIQYTIPNLVDSRNANVILKIYDVLGREVRTLVNEVKSPGRYQVQFDASRLSTGIYFYTIKAGSFYQTKKMMLIK